MTSIEIQRGLDGFDLHAALTYLDNEALVRVRTLPLHTERYVLLAPAGSAERRGGIGWAEAAGLPLGLLVSEMQNRRIVDAAFRRAGRTPRPVVETDSMVALIAHVRHAGLFAVAPASLPAELGLCDGIGVVPLVEPEISRVVGLAVADRSPLPPLVAALWAQAGGRDRADA